MVVLLLCDAFAPGQLGDGSIPSACETADITDFSRKLRSQRFAYAVHSHHCRIFGKFRSQIIWAISPFYIAYAAVEILSGTICGTGDLVIQVVITALCTCLFRVICVSLCRHFGLNIQYVAYSYAITWALSTVVFAIYYLRGNWLKRRISATGYAPERR